MSLSLTELRQRLFQLADQVAESGVPLEIERRGVRLRLVRVDELPAGGRLARLREQSLVLGKPLDPSESPASWSESDLPMVAQTAPDYPPGSRSRRPRKGS